MPLTEKKKVDFDFELEIINLLPIYRPRPGYVAGITKIFTAAVEKHHFTVLRERAIKVDAYKAAISNFFFYAPRNSLMQEI